MITIDTDKCAGCGDCAAFCPNDCIGLEFFQGRTVAYAEPEDCISCGICESECPSGAISQSG